MCVRHRSTLLLFIVIIIIKQVVVTLRCDRNSNSTMCKQWQTCIWICADVGVVAMDSNISRSQSMEIKRGRKEFAHSARHAQLLGYDLFFFVHDTNASTEFRIKMSQNPRICDTNTITITIANLYTIVYLIDIFR